MRLHDGEPVNIYTSSSGGRRFVCEVLQNGGTAQIRIPISHGNWYLTVAGTVTYSGTAWPLTS
jgi:hypothetical protein